MIFKNVYKPGDLVMVTASEHLGSMIGYIVDADEHGVAIDDECGDSVTYVPWSSVSAVYGGEAVAKQFQTYRADILQRRERIMNDEPVDDPRTEMERKLQEMFGGAVSVSIPEIDLNGFMDRRPDLTVEQAEEELRESKWGKKE